MQLSLNIIKELLEDDFVTGVIHKSEFEDFLKRRLNIEFDDYEEFEILLRDQNEHFLCVSKNEIYFTLNSSFLTVKKF